MKSKKLNLKKITISNLNEDLAKRIYGGYDVTVAECIGTFGNNCTKSCNGGPCTQDCHSNACPSGPNQPGCTDAQHGCTATGVVCPSANSPCFSQMDCTYGNCTDLNATCQPTYTDNSCPGGNCP